MPRTEQQSVKVDRRVQRTRQLLQDALIALILEKGYDDVLIQDITDRANLSRATFYLHFRDKEDLLMYSLRTVFDTLAQNMGPLSSDDLTWNGAPPSLVAFQHAAENRDLYRVILSARSTRLLTEGIRAYLAERIRQEIKDVIPADKLLVPIEVVSQHMASSLFGLIVWWLENNVDYTPEQMAEMYHHLNAAAFLYIAAKASDETVRNRL